MKTNKEALADDKYFIEKQKSENWFERDIVLNVNFQESMMRCLVALFVPWFAILGGPKVIIYVGTPVMFYLFLSGMIHFCFVRYTWQHFIKHIPTPEKCQFAIDLNIPIKAV